MLGYCTYTFSPIVAKGVIFSVVSSNLDQGEAYFIMW
jgi:hypothetical protein